MLPLDDQRFWRRLTAMYLRGYRRIALGLALFQVLLMTWRMAVPQTPQARLQGLENAAAALCFGGVALVTQRTAPTRAAMERVGWLLLGVALAHMMAVQAIERDALKGVVFLLIGVGVGVLFPRPRPFVPALALVFLAWAATLPRVPVTKAETWAIAWVTVAFIATGIHLFLNRMLADVARLFRRDKRLLLEKIRLVGSLQDALAEIRTLGQLVPICAKCKMVRNDAGFWEQVESFVSTRTGTSFSHGYCPGCLQEAREELEALKREFPRP